MIRPPIDTEIALMPRRARLLVFSVLFAVASRPVIMTAARRQSLENAAESVDLAMEAIADLREDLRKFEPEGLPVPTHAELTAENKALRGALKPFAEFAECFDCRPGDVNLVVRTARSSTSFLDALTVAHLRAARAALTEEPPHAAE